MKVLLVSPKPPPYGGIAHWTELILAHAGSAGGEGVQLTVLDTAPRQRRGLEVSRAARLREGVGRMFVDVKGLARHLRSARPDVVHLNTSGQLAFVRDAVMAWLMGVAKVPFVYHLRFGRVPEIRQRQSVEWKVAKLALRRAATVIALDPATEQALLASGVPKRVVRIPNPIPDERFVSSESATSRDPVVLFVGWVIPAKGVGELFAAWRTLDTRGWTLRIAGPVDETYGAELSAYGIPDSVELVGSLSNAEVLEQMTRCRVFVLPSHTEGFPNAVLEAMASGAAIVATSVGAIPDMLRSGAGIAVPPGDAGELANALSELMRDPARTQSLGRVALESAKRRFALSHVFSLYVDVWRAAAGCWDRPQSDSQPGAY